MNSNYEIDDPMILPERGYGPFCLKILKEFIEYHYLPKIPMPEPGLQTHISISRIMDAILLSMGDKKRKEILKELEEYKQGLPDYD